MFQNQDNKLIKVNDNTYFYSFLDGSIIHMACEFGDVEMVKLVMEHVDRKENGKSKKFLEMYNGRGESMWHPGVQRWLLSF